jgi:hypothetical protein
MKKLLIIVLLAAFSSCHTHYQGLKTSEKNQAMSVKLNRNQAKGLKKASIVVNKRYSDADKN